MTFLSSSHHLPHVHRDAAMNYSQCEIHKILKASLTLDVSQLWKKVQKCHFNEFKAIFDLKIMQIKHFYLYLNAAHPEPQTFSH